VWLCSCATAPNPNRRLTPTTRHPAPNHTTAPDTHAPDAPTIQGAVNWALTELRAGREIYVHCAHGHGRSATLLAAILIAEGEAAGADAAVALMRCALLVRLLGKGWGGKGEGAGGFSCCMSLHASTPSQSHHHPPNLHVQAVPPQGAPEQEAARRTAQLDRFHREAELNTLRGA